jgi:hypothetical protein
MMLAAALGLAVEMGNNVPIWDEWALVPYVTGDKPVTLSWLWSLHNEHRIVLPRLVYVPLVRLTGDYRSLNVFNAMALGGIAAAFVLVTRRIRGRTEWADALFPLVLLKMGIHLTHVTTIGSVRRHGRQ